MCAIADQPNGIFTGCVATVSNILSGVVVLINSLIDFNVWRIVLC